MGKTLIQMGAEVFENNTNKGWFDEDRSFGDDIALLHSEVSEMFEAYRDWGAMDMTSPADPNYIETHDHPKPQGIHSEAADILIRLLDTCFRYGIDLEAEYERKMAYNRTRPVKHGGKRL